MERNSNASLWKSRCCLNGATWTAFAQSEGLDKISGGAFVARQKANAGILRSAQNDNLEGIGGRVRGVARFFLISELVS